MTDKVKKLNEIDPIYKKYIEDTYLDVFGKLQHKLDHNHGKPTLVMSLQYPAKPSLTEIFSDTAKQHRLGAAIPHIIAMTVAARAVGKENIIVSFEMDPERLKSLDVDVRRPMDYALRFARESGFKIVGTDTGNKEAEANNPDNFIEESLDPIRKKKEIASINELAAGKPRIVVHIGSVLPPYNLFGFNENQNPDRMENPKVFDAIDKSPFREKYGDPFIINVTDADAPMGGSTFLKNSSISAVQAPLPGASISDSDSTKIAAAIEEMAKLLEPSPLPAAPKTPSGPKR
jgi:hypothetical protein